MPSSCQPACTVSCSAGSTLSRRGQRRAARIASVIGRGFTSSLVASAYPDLGVEPMVHDDLLRLTATRLMGLENPESRAFAFAHAVTRDVAYDSLPNSMRTVLHGCVGDLFSRQTPGGDGGGGGGGGGGA